MNWIEQISRNTPDPRAAESGLSAIAYNWPSDLPPLDAVLNNESDIAKSVAKLFSLSKISVEKIQRDPAVLCWLADSAVHSVCRGKLKMELDLKELLTEEDLPGALRKFKSRELLRIAYREVNDLADVAETGVELANVAQITVEQLLKSVHNDLVRRWGEPGSSLVVLGMGKLGGQELNYSSDIDLIFFFGEDGIARPGFSRQEYFARLCQRLVVNLSEGVEGPLFRVDLRLRPEGSDGAIVRSLVSLEHYYAGYGETWERMALIKARRIAGSEELAYDFERTLQAFIYPRTMSDDLVEEVAAIKDRIERETVGAENLYRNVKLGIGGIREIEFIIQTLQLLHAAKQPFLQERNTLRALEALRQSDLLPPKDVFQLYNAYIFLRKIEHRLQIEGELQTHTLPESPEALEKLAHGLNFSDATSLESQLSETTSAVRAVFERLLKAGNRMSAQSDLSAFSNPEATRRALESLGAPDLSRHVSLRTRRLYRRLEPLLLREFSSCPDPDAALNSFVQFVEVYGIRGLLYETLAANPRLLELLARLFSGSRFLTRAVLRRPQWIEEIARTGQLSATLSPADHLAALRASNQNEPLESLRVYRLHQTLRIGLRDLLEFAPPHQVQAEITALAEACVLHAIELCNLEDVLTVVAMGKFGGHELAYGADLDLVLVGNSAEPAISLIKALSERSAEGVVYPVDVRLRPEGDAGPLAAPLSTFEKYFKSRAQLWEIQALTKARVLSGPHAKEFEDMAKAAWDSVACREDLFDEIRKMHQRIVRHRSGGKKDYAIKTGPGGIMAAEFLVQALQMRHGIRETNTLHALRRLSECGAMGTDAVDVVHAGYTFLRRIEMILRRQDDASVSELPEKGDELLQVARWMGYHITIDFEREVARHCNGIQQVFDAILQTSEAT